FFGNAPPASPDEKGGFEKSALGGKTTRRPAEKRGPPGHRHDPHERPHFEGSAGGLLWISSEKNPASPGIRLLRISLRYPSSMRSRIGRPLPSQPLFSAGLEAT